MAGQNTSNYELLLIRMSYENLPDIFSFVVARVLLDIAAATYHSIEQNENRVYVLT